MEMDDDLEIEEEADEEVDKVLIELTQGISVFFNLVGIIGTTVAPVGGLDLQEKQEKDVETALKNRMEALKN